MNGRIYQIDEYRKKDNTNLIEHARISNAELLREQKRLHEEKRELMRKIERDNKILFLFSIICATCAIISVIMVNL